MNVLISGSHGLIGTPLMARLHDGGHRVLRLVRPGSAAAASGQEPGTVRWDPAEGTIDQEALEAAGPIDAVVNLAGAGIGDRRWSTRYRQEILHSRLGATRLLVRALSALEAAPSVLVSGSAIGYYGDRGDEVLTEASESGEGFLAEVSREWESAALPLASSDTRVVLVRTGIVLSAAGGALGKQLPLFRFGLGARLGSGAQYVSWISLDDEVSIIMRALTDPDLVGPINATAPAPITNAAFTKAVGHALHRPAVLAVPSPAIKLALGKEMADEMLLGGQRVLPAKLQGLGHHFEHPDIETALAALFPPSA